MEKIRLILLLGVGFAVCLFIACVGVPIASNAPATLKEGENLAIDVESMNFYEKLTITSLEGGRVKITVDSSVPRNDEFSREVCKKFKEKFWQASQERRVAILPKAPIKLKIGLAYGVKPVKGGEVRILAAVASFSKLTIDGAAPIVEIMVIGQLPVSYGIQASLESSQILVSAKTLAENLGNRLANDTIHYLREKGELKK